ncbi:hypothetical protein Tco_1053124 [Tanacetum coccineum]
MLRTHKFKRLYKGRSRIEGIDKDAEVTLVETQRRNDENDDNMMFDTGVFDAQEITLAQALATMKSAKPMEKDVVQESSENVNVATIMVSTATTTVVATPAITTPPQQRAKGIAFRELVESTKDQMALDEELARENEAEEQAEFQRIQKERAVQKEASRAAIYEEWDNEQAIMEADYKLATSLQENEREAMSIEEKPRRLA